MRSNPYKENPIVSVASEIFRYKHTNTQTHTDILLLNYKDGTIAIKKTYLQQKSLSFSLITITVSMLLSNAFFHNCEKFVGQRVS